MLFLHLIYGQYQLREELDSGSLISFDSETSPHDVASLLKEYLRDLPEPLLCRSLYPAFLSTQSKPALGVHHSDTHNSLYFFGTMHSRPAIYVLVRSSVLAQYLNESMPFKRRATHADLSVRVMHMHIARTKKYGQVNSQRV